jgi:hypothetical protein
VGTQVAQLLPHCLPEAIANLTLQGSLLCLCLCGLLVGEASACGVGRVWRLSSVERADACAVAGRPPCVCAATLPCCVHQCRYPSKCCPGTVRPPPHWPTLRQLFGLSHPGAPPTAVGAGHVPCSSQAASLACAQAAHIVTSFCCNTAVSGGCGWHWHFCVGRRTVLLVLRQPPAADLRHVCTCQLRTMACQVYIVHGM